MMNNGEAYKKDKAGFLEHGSDTFYAEEETEGDGTYYVFGTETGFAYCSSVSQEWAEDKAAEMNQELKDA